MFAVNLTVLAALVAASAALLLVPHPAAALARAQGRRPPWRVKVPGTLPPLLRALAGIAAATAALLLVPGVSGLVAGAVLGPAAWVGSGFVRRRVDVRDAVEQLPGALEFLAVALDAGQPMVRAVEAVAAVSRAPTGTVLAEVAARLALGQTPQDAWAQLRGDPVWGRVAADVARAERSGTALADLLRIHADDARRERDDEALKAARKVGVKSVIPLMLCFLPAFILVGVVPIIAGLLKGFFG